MFFISLDTISTLWTDCDSHGTCPQDIQHTSSCMFSQSSSMCSTDFIFKYSYKNKSRHPLLKVCMEFSAEVQLQNPFGIVRSFSSSVSHFKNGCSIWPTSITINCFYTKHTGCTKHQLLHHNVKQNDDFLHSSICYFVWSHVHSNETKLCVGKKKK
jgi:hypothetical protein